MNILKIMVIVAGIGLAIYAIYFVAGTILCVSGIIQLNHLLEPKREALEILNSLL